MKVNEDKEKEKALLEKDEKRKKREEIVKEKKEKKSQMKAKKNREKQKTSVETDETSTDSDAFSIQDSEKDYQESFFSEYEDDVDLTLNPGDFCVTKVFGKTANYFRLFVARVMEKENGGYIVSFFKRYNPTMKFKETEEESFIRESDIVRKLTQPITASSARYNNMIGFAEDLSDLTNIH